MAFRRFVKRHQFIEDGVKRVIPRGWAGEVSAEVAKAADAAGVTVSPGTAPAPAEQAKPAAKAKE